MIYFPPSHSTSAQFRILQPEVSVSLLLPSTISILATQCHLSAWRIFDSSTPHRSRQVKIAAKLSTDPNRQKPLSKTPAPFQQRCRDHTLPVKLLHSRALAVSMTARGASLGASPAEISCTCPCTPRMSGSSQRNDRFSYKRQ